MRCSTSPFRWGAWRGPVLMGWDFDLHGTYCLSLGVSSVMLISSAMSLLLLDRYRQFPAT